MNKFLKFVFDSLVKSLFWFRRWIKHNAFLIWLDNEAVGRPSIISLPFVFARKKINFIEHTWNRKFVDHLQFSCS